MKQIIFILIIAGFYSCQKCGDCETTYTYIPASAGTTPAPKVVEYDLCGVDYKQADGRHIETSYPDGNGGIVKQIAKTTCK